MPEQIRILVTEVTMFGKLRCVAGWDLDRGGMVRPEPAAAEFWPLIQCGPQTTFHPGHIVSFVGEKPETDLPHQTEDWVVLNGTLQEHHPANAHEFRCVCIKSLSHSPVQVFGDNLHIQRDKAYIWKGSNCGSLCAVDLPASELALHQEQDDKGNWKLRAHLPVAGHLLNLSVTAKDLRQTFWNKGGLQAARAALGEANSFHIRLGLAREMNGEGKCYLQINGIYPVT